MKCLAVCVILVPAAAIAELGQEGSGGRLNMSISGSQVSLTLTVPAQDVLEEGQALAPEEAQAQLAGAVSDLGKPLDLFVLPSDAGCFAATASVALAGEGLGPQAETEALQSEFSAEYLIECQDMGRLDSIRFQYFKRFPAAQSLRLTLSVEGQTQSMDISPDAPVLDLSDVR